MRHKIIWSICLVSCLTYLGTMGFEAGQNQSQSGPPAGTVISPPEEIDPVRQQLVEELRYYRKLDNSTRAEAILKLLDPSISFMPSQVPSDIIVIPGTEVPQDIPGWADTDIPVFTSSSHDNHPVMDLFRSGTNYPMIFAACDEINTTSGQFDKIKVMRSSDHGMTWPNSFSIDSAYALSEPQIKQISDSHVGIVYQRWSTPSFTNVLFTRVNTSLASSITTIIDASSDIATSAYLTSDVEDYGSAAFLYVVYYRVHYQPDVTPSMPYKHDLMFTKSLDKGDSWSAPVSLGSFVTAGGVPIYCSIDYEDNTLVVAYIGESTRDIRVRRSQDFGSTWSSPTILITGDVLDPEVAVGDSTHAIVVFTRVVPGNEDPQYFYTNYFTMWTIGTLSTTIDLQNSPVVRHYDGYYYAAFRDQTLQRIYVTNGAPIDSPIGYFLPLTSVKDSSNSVTMQSHPVGLVAKPGPTGVVGPAAMWAEDRATEDVYFDGSWQPIPNIRTPILNIGFGSVVMGNSLDIDTGIANDGNGPLTINSVTRSSGSAYFTYQAPATPFAIGAGLGQPITIRFAPGTVGSFNATFNVNSNDPDTPNTTFSVSGTGAAAPAPDINMPDNPYDFGNVTVGVSQLADLSVQNLGNATLTISGVALTSGSSEFTIVSYPPSITAGGAGIIQVGFTPTGTGLRSATFTISSNDPDETSYNLTTSGMGIASTQRFHKHAVGDFDGDGSDEVAIDFGASGAWMWNGGTWSQLSTNNPENMIAFNIDGNADDELALDLGSLGLWMWNGGAWTQFSVSNPEYLIAVDTNGNGSEELIIDFGAAGLRWRQESGYMFGMTPYDPQDIIAADVDGNGNAEVLADFGATGMWLWEAVGTTWNQLTTADSNTMTKVDVLGFGNEGIAAGLGGLGSWLWDSGMWSQLSGVYSDQLIAGRMISGGGEEIAGDFGLLGLWLWGSSVWSQLSGVNADEIIAADGTGNGTDEVAGDFASLGLWLWNSGSWTQLSGVNPEKLLAGNIDGDSAMELIVDFGSLGVWTWNGGTWSQISAVNPD